MSRSNFHTRFSPPQVPGLVCSGGLTDQHFKSDCDLNVILKKYRGDVPQPLRPGIYADLTALPSSLAEAFERVQFAQDWFDSLPSDVRSSFGNDPTVALRLVMSNPEAAVTAGLLPKSELKPAEGDHSKAVEAATPEPPKEAAKEASASEEGHPKA